MSKLVTSTSIPASWNLIPLKELGDWSGGGTPSKAKPQYWQGGTIPWVSPKDMKTERIADSEDHITKEAVSHSTASLINADSVLIVTRSGILRHTLPVAVNSVPVTVNQDLKALTPRNGIMAEYVAWALRAFSRDILHTCSKQGTTVNSVDTSKLLGFEIPVAPRGQQAKIVAEIEKQFSRLDEAVASLKRVRANLKRYRAAVLKAAVEGKLTEDWRKQHPNVEPASKLLERILSERQAKWKGRREYEEPAVADTSDLPSLPRGWTWTQMDTVCDKIQDGTHFSPKEQSQAGGFKYITAKNIKPWGLDLSELTYVSERVHREIYSRCNPEKGDVFLIKDGVTTGIATVNLLDEEISLLSSVALLKPVRSTLDSHFLKTWLNSPAGHRTTTGKMTGTAIKRIILEKIREAPMPLPPFNEQQVIVAEVERRLSVIEELESAVDANRKRADRLRASVLASAFRGELVEA